MRLLLLFLLLIAAGPGNAAETKAKSSSNSSSTVSDADLEKDIKARFARSKLASNNLQVAVRSGVATIDGQVHVIQHKGIATRMARTAGAKQVINRIKIDEAARKKAADQLSRSRPATVKRTP